MGEEYNKLDNKDIIITNLFSADNEYIIPIYQRDYAWESEEVEQLINDIIGIDDGTDKYYMGTLVVFQRKDGKFEVIDGQQRLTTLFILFCIIRLFDKNDDFISNDSVLSFDCREESNQCLKELFKIESINDLAILNGKYDNNITKNAIEIKDFLLGKDSLTEKLKKVDIFRVGVPKNTDLNHYFEIMNTRGEQLEHTDIIKSRLMFPLRNKPKDLKLFAKIWDACSDMGHYVQIGIPYADSLRNSMFSKEWNQYPKSINWNNDTASTNQEGTAPKRTISWAIEGVKNNQNLIKLHKTDENGQSNDTGYNSIISFPYFLLQSFRVYADEKDLKPDWNSTLNDRDLIKDFNKIFNNCTEKESKDFVLFLLQLRFLFDKYILKRYYVNNDSDGIWTIRSYEKPKKEKKEETRYKSTFSSNDSEEDNSDVGEKCVKLQSCLRVSFTSPRTMHWIKYSLKWLYDKYKQNNTNIDCSEFNEFLTEYIVMGKEQDDSISIKKFLDNNDYSQGVQTPRLVLNFLDFCIWDKYKGSTESPYKDIDIANFKFEFRNSVEHYYPRKANEADGIVPWDDVDEFGHPKYDQFGNLALLQRSINSKFSNLPPKAKREFIEGKNESDEETKTTRKKKRGIFSLKLQIMAGLTKTNDGWKDDVCKKHGEDMINILKKVCYEVEQKVKNREKTS